MEMNDLEMIAGLLNVEPVALFMAPHDFGLAVAIHRFAKLADQIGAARAGLLLDGLGAPPHRECSEYIFDGDAPEEQMKAQTSKEFRMLRAVRRLDEEQLDAALTILEGIHSLTKRVHTH